MSQSERAASPQPAVGIPSFARTLEAHGLSLTRGRARILQINVGRLCNLACKHCHLEAGPARTEIMTRRTMDQVSRFARKCDFQVADITGGAPEMVEDLPYLIEALAPLVKTCMLRSNLVALSERGREELLGLLKAHGIALVASFPSIQAAQADAQRGAGVWDASVAMLVRLNELGWGVEGSGLELNLVSNPAGAFLPPDQAVAEKRFKKELMRRCGVSFNALYTFANVPLGRYRAWLERSGNFDQYMAKLHGGFNPCTIDGLMCRSLISVDWEGFLHDCDFHLAAGLPMGGEKRHVSDMEGLPPEGQRIATGDHCYACTAGSGFT